MITIAVNETNLDSFLYITTDGDLRKKRNEVRSKHWFYLRQCSNKNGGKVEFKVVDIIQFLEEDPYYQEDLVDDWMIYPSTIIERNSSITMRDFIVEERKKKKDSNKDSNV